ncbi:flavodoxin family protein [Clostridium sp. Sa3CUN1]|uniref:Flavodoxin family protein n=1 Tax=Clostridium gallinarum TaxID=2762246 RepID=A0ABR8Q4R4_9CLOT|nr:flavodoxin family protein [Clostridium gallinarum]MBD7915398.1 flavodoxin family protein [Clostridium gallinarum]
MKKILLINSSNRKKNTYKLLCSIEDILKNKGYETELISLSSFKIDFCKGCEACILKGSCFIKDEANIIMQKIIKSDGLVIGTPVYLNNMSGILKTFIDRTCSWFHRSEIAKKPTLIIANTQGSGLENTLNSIKEVMIQWGAFLGGTISRNGRNFNQPIEEKELVQFIKLIESKGKCYEPSFKEIYTYNIQRALATNIFPIDKEYWIKKGWLDKEYFPGVKLNIIQKIYCEGLYKLLIKVIEPNNKNN